MIKSNLKPILNSFMEQIWNKGNFENVEYFIDSKYEIKNDPGDPWDGQIIDISTFKERVSYSRNAFPDLRFEIQEMIEDNGKIAIRWIMLGTHEGDLPQLLATGREFSINGMTFYYFKGNKISGHSQCFDQLGFLTQIKSFGM